MKKLTLLVVLLSLYACSSTNLSNEEAKKIILDQYPPEPLVYGMSIPDRERTNNITNKLVSSGVLFQKYPGVYLPTPKGIKDRQIRWSQANMGNMWDYTGAVVKKRVRDIKEVLVDAKNNTAIVTVTFGIESFEPYYSLICVDSSCRYYGDGINKIIDTVKVKMKKYDKGWRVEED